MLVKTMETRLFIGILNLEPEACEKRYRLRNTEFSKILQPLHELNDDFYKL
jgi:hypothetical protein